MNDSQEAGLSAGFQLAPAREVASGGREDCVYVPQYFGPSDRLTLYIITWSLIHDPYVGGVDEARFPRIYQCSNNQDNFKLFNLQS